LRGRPRPRADRSAGEAARRGPPGARARRRPAGAAADGSYMWGTCPHENPAHRYPDVSVATWGRVLAPRGAPCRLTASNDFAHLLENAADPIQRRALARRLRKWASARLAAWSAG